MIRYIIAFVFTTLLTLAAMPMRTSAATPIDALDAREQQDGCAPGKENACRCAGMMWCHEIGGPLPIKPFRCNLTRSAEADTSCSTLEGKIAADCAARARTSIGGGEWHCSAVSQKTGARTLHCTGYLK